MSEKIRIFRAKKSLKGSDVVEVVQELYPRFDKVMLSKCENGDLYGVDLRRDAMKLLVERFAPERAENAATRDYHSQGYQIRCRIPESERRQLQQALTANHTTIQSWMRGIIRNYIKGGGKTMENIPDHPSIRNAEWTGYSGSREADYPICPVCGESCETMYKDRYGAYVGCDVCMEAKDAWIVDDCFPEKEGEDG